MALRNAPGEWRWEQRGDKWWRIHEVLRIMDGPYDARVVELDGLVDRPDRVDRGADPVPPRTMTEGNADGVDG